MSRHCAETRFYLDLCEDYCSEWRLASRRDEQISLEDNSDNTIVLGFFGTHSMFSKSGLLQWQHNVGSEAGALKIANGAKC